MSRIIQCPSCEKQLKLGESSAQKSVISCPACSQKIRISPSAEQESSSPPPPTPAPAPPPRARKATPQSSRNKRPQRQPTRRREPDYDDDLFGAMPTRSTSKNRKRPRAGSQSQTGPVALLIGGVCLAMLLGAGAIWFVINTLSSARSSGQETLAQTDASEPLEAASANPTETAPPNFSNGADSDGSRAVQPPADFGNQPVAPTTPPVTPPANRGVRPTVAKGDPIRYGFKAGDVHVYTFELDAEIDNQTLSFPGSVTLRVASGRAARADEIESGTGTGFVVSSDGYMITCHHVVENATSIQATLGNQTYSGRVVAIDADQDLAIVKIDAQNLSTVFLGNSDRVQLAEDVRAIGYPLTDLLGQDLKVTGGAISGINNRSDGRRFQIDANINPGNSGGPLLNGQGQVIAVNSAKLIAGSEISSVGFSVPINYARQLLQQNGVRFQSKEGGNVMSGPALVKSVQPAVALLQVESRRRINQQYVLNYSGSYRDPTASSLPGGFGPRMSFGPSLRGGTTYSNGRVVLDEFGAVDQYEDKAQLPFSTGSMALLMIHQMADDGAKSWSHEDRFVLTKPKNRNNGFPGFPSGIPMPPSPFGRRSTQEPDEILTGGIETHRYRVISSNAKEIRIERNYELVTLDNPARPMTKITGKGTIVFDRGYQLPKSMSYRQTYESNSDGEHISIPINISYRMQDPEIRKKQEADRAQAIADKKAQKEAQAAQEAAMSDSERLDFYIAEIKAGRGRDVYGKLAQMEVVESRQEEVCRLLEGGLKARHPERGHFAALGQWATARIVNVMIVKLESMDNSDWPAGRVLIPAIAKSGDERAIKPIVKKLAQRSHPWHEPAQKALAVYGEKAEDAVLELLSVSPSAQAVEALKGVGTKKSLPVLKEIAGGKDYRMKQAAKEAITEIALRL